MLDVVTDDVLPVDLVLPRRSDPVQQELLEYLSYHRGTYGGVGLIYCIDCITCYFIQGSVPAVKVILQRRLDPLQQALLGYLYTHWSAPKPVKAILRELSR